jgi:hypothetical protein
MSPALFFAQHVSNASTFIFRSLRLCLGILLWFDVCWRYGVVRLGWCVILMQVEAVLLRMCVGILLWFDVCWRCGVVRLGWCGILMQAEALLPHPA